jgi:hypothetical protein
MPLPPYIKVELADNKRIRRLFPELGLLPPDRGTAFTRVLLTKTWTGPSCRYITLHRPRTFRP